MDSTFIPGVFFGVFLGLLFSVFIGTVAEKDGVKEGLEAASPCIQGSLKTQVVRNRNWVCANGVWSQQ